MCVKLGTKFAVEKHVEMSMDGFLILVALAFAAGQTGALSVSVQDGMDEHISTLSSSKIEEFQKVRPKSPFLNKRNHK